MRKDFNQESFMPYEVKQGKHIKFLKALLSLDAVGEEVDYDKYHDIHIWNDGYCLVIDWCDHWYDNNIETSSFQFVDSDELVVKEVILPDNSTVYASSEEEAKELLDEFLKDNPQWHKNQFGMWTDYNGDCPEYDTLKDRYTTTSASTSDEPITIEPLKWEGNPVIYNED